MLPLLSIEKLEKILNYLPCRELLVFGLGNDSILWLMNNFKNNTTFVEHNEKYIDKMKDKVQDLIRVDIVKAWYREDIKSKLNDILREYDTNKNQKGLFPRIDKPIYAKLYDVILVDSPEGCPYTRFQSILTAKYAAREDGVIIIDDYERADERKICLFLFDNNEYNKEIFTDNNGKELLIIQKKI